FLDSGRNKPSGKNLPILATNRTKHHTQFRWMEVDNPRVSFEAFSRENLDSHGRASPDNEVCFEVAAVRTQFGGTSIGRGSSDDDFRWSREEVPGHTTSFRLIPIHDSRH